MKILSKTTINIYTPGSETPETPKSKVGLDAIGHKEVLGRLDMVIAFDTTGSMAAYIDDVRRQVAEMVPRLFKENKDLRLGIVAFGDYCDMESANDFGDAYQCLPLTDNENAIVRFVKEAGNTGGGDGDEFYELVINKIVNETNWRENSTRAVLLIADANPHEVGYSYGTIVYNAQIDWREEARRAAAKNIRFDTVTITRAPWYKELSAMTNGISVPFSSSGKTSELVEATAMARGSMESRRRWREKARKAAESGDGETRMMYSCMASTALNFDGEALFDDDDKPTSK